MKIKRTGFLALVLSLGMVLQTMPWNMAAVYGQELSKAVTGITETEDAGTDTPDAEDAGGEAINAEGAGGEDTTGDTPAAENATEEDAGAEDVSPDTPDAEDVSTEDVSADTISQDTISGDQAEEASDEITPSLNCCPDGHCGGFVMPEEGEAGVETTYLGWGTESMAKKADTKARELVSSMINDDMSDIQKAMIIGEYLFEVPYGGFNTEYKGQTAYEALVKGCAVCAGKAQAFCMMAYYAGLNTNMVMSNKSNHAWNEIELDGNWYFMDPTNLGGFSTILHTESTFSTFYRSDIETYVCGYNEKYLYDKKVHRATDSTFQGIVYYSYNSSTQKRVADYSIFRSNCLSKGIHTEYYVCTAIKGISANYISAEPPYENDTLKKSRLSVYTVKKTGTPTAPPTLTKAKTLSSSSYSISPSKLVLGTNNITVTYKKSGRVMTTTLTLTARPDEVISTELSGISVVYGGGSVYVGEEVDKSDLTVTPSYIDTWHSGKKDYYTKDPVTDYLVLGSVTYGRSTLKAAYTAEDETRMAPFYVNGILPELTGITASVSQYTFTSGAPVVLQGKNAAVLHLSNGTTRTVDVCWEDFSGLYDPEGTSQQSFNATGTITLPADVANSNGVSLTISQPVKISAPASKLAAVTFDRTAGTCQKSTTLHLTSSGGGTIYYSLNDEPYLQYNGGIPLEGTLNAQTVYTVKAYAHKAGYQDSAVTTKTYTVTLGDTDGGLASLERTLVLMKGQKGSVGPAGCTYTASVPEVVSINKKGIAKGKAAGETVITLTGANGAMGTCDVTVEDPSFAEKKTYLIAGDMAALSLGGTTQDVTYTASGKGGTISGTVLRTTGKGTVKVAAYVCGKKYKTSYVVENPSFKKPVITLKKGKKSSCKLSGTKRGDVVYTSSDSSVATVSGGKVYGAGYGNAVITATVGGHSYSCRVTVW